jgi:hypothetical protein
MYSTQYLRMYVRLTPHYIGYLTPLLRTPIWVWAKYVLVLRNNALGARVVRGESVVPRTHEPLPQQVSCYVMYVLRAYGNVYSLPPHVCTLVFTLYAYGATYVEYIELGLSTYN